MTGSPKNHFSKVYCSECDTVFDSREKFDRHLPHHSAMICEACPIDTAIERLFRLFQRKSRSLE